MPAVVTVTQPAVTVTPTSTSHTSSTLTSGDIASIVIGCLLGCALLAALVFFLHRRYRLHKFTRVPNPHDSVSSSRAATDPSRSPRAKSSVRHSQKPSVSEPLIAPLSWPPIPLTSRVHSPTTPTRPDSVSPGLRGSQFSIGEVNQVTFSHSTAPAILDIPPVRIPEQASSSQKPPQTLFVHRMLQSRAHASDFVSLAHHPSLDSVPSRSPSVDSATIHADMEQLFADVERAALQDAQVAQKEEDDWDKISTCESVYSQLSAAHDQPPLSRQNSVSVVRRKSSRKQLPPAELTPVAEVPDTPRYRTNTLSIGPNSSFDAQVSHGTRSRPISPVLDEAVAFPLLTSVNFGKESAPTLGSITSTAGLGSNSSGRASRYPSLAPSSIGQSSQSGSRSDGGTDWRHPPPGLSGLKTLQIGALRNPHSPTEDRAERSFGPDPEERRARLRQGTVSSVPEVERRAVLGAGIAHIDVVL